MTIDHLFCKQNGNWNMVKLINWNMVKWISIESTQIESLWTRIESNLEICIDTHALSNIFYLSLSKWLKKCLKLAKMVVFYLYSFSFSIFHSVNSFVELIHSFPQCFFLPSLSDTLHLTPFPLIIHHWWSVVWPDGGLSELSSTLGQLGVDLPLLPPSAAICRSAGRGECLLCTNL